MSKSLDIMRIDDAVGRKNKFDRSRTHLTTLDFAEIVPIFHEDMVNGDSYNVSASLFNRLAPLSVPTYGKCSQKTATMFVPYYQVFESAEAWFGGKNVSKGSSVLLPCITKVSLIRLFSNTSSLATSTTSSSYDFCYTYTPSSGLSTRYFKFTKKGRWVYKVLRSLGYQIPNLVSTGSDLASAPGASYRLNALPFLCFFKAYNDYMSQSQRFDTSFVTQYLEDVRLNRTRDNWYNSTTANISFSGLAQLFDAVYLQYENDYFTSCWCRPNNPINNVAGELTQINYQYDLSNQRAIYSGVDNVELYTSGSSATTLSARGLSFLKAFDNWVRRNNYSGSKDVERIYSRFGIKPEDYKAQYAHLVLTTSDRVSVGDVTSLTDSKSTTGGAVLGDFAGKGIGNSDFNYVFKSPDYGLLITLAWITPSPMYADGFDRTVLKHDIHDFFNPEFDGLGGNPVSQQELFVDRKNSTHSDSKDASIFGFNERYDEYKTGNLDQITGDFCIFNDMSSWHFNREDLKALQESSHLVAQDGAFHSVNNSDSSNQYNRIFNAENDRVSDGADHFYVIAQFNVSALRPMKSMNQVPELGEGALLVPRNGNNIN